MESLNLDENIKRLIRIALSKYRSERMQATALGISTKTLYLYRKKYNFPINEQRNKEWYRKNRIKDFRDY